ncbi:hypothetical protein CR513_30541, partial [Mucuna pruriens]
MVNEIGTASNLRLENQLSKLTSLVRQLAFGQHQPNMAAKAYGICTSMEHPTNLCPTMGSNHIRTGHLIISSMEDNHFSQDRIKGLTQCIDSDLHRMYLKDQQATNSRVRNIKHHFSNSNNSRECHLKAILHL